MTFALIIVSLIALTGWGLAFALMNRLLIQAGVQPVTLPKYRSSTDMPEPKETRRKIASVPVPF